MKEKIEKLRIRSLKLMEHGFSKLDQFNNGFITEEEFQKELNWIDKENQNILAEFAVLELLENINYN